MRTLAGILLMASLLTSAGCSRGAASTTTAAPPKDRYAGWPASTMKKPDMAGAVEHDALRVPDDAEPARVQSTFLMPDWAEQISPLAYNGPKGARIEIHYLERGDQLRKQDDAKIKRMIAAKAKDRVVAPPWKGWFGEAGSAHAEGLKSVALRVRIYSLFQETRYLELHAEWPTGNKAAQGEADHLVRYVAYSIQDYKKAANDAQE